MKHEIIGKKSFEIAFQKSYVQEQELQHQIRELTVSKNDLISEMEKVKFDHKQQINQLNDELSKTKSELSICQAEFREYKQKSKEMD